MRNGSLTLTGPIDQLDGASVWRQYWGLTMPLVRPALAALATLLLPAGTDISVFRVIAVFIALTLFIAFRNAPGGGCAAQGDAVVGQAILQQSAHADPFPIRRTYLTGDPLAMALAQVARGELVNHWTTSIRCVPWSVMLPPA